MVDGVSARSACLSTCKVSNNLFPRHLFGRFRQLSDEEIEKLCLLREINFTKNVKLLK